jgi:hypothetical protein
MERTLEIAGRCVADAVKHLAGEGLLVPFVGIEDAEGFRAQRFAADSMEGGVEAARAWLAENPEEVARAVLVFDGAITLGGKPTDALIAECASYRGMKRGLTVVVPYRAARGGQPFAVHAPRFTALDGVESYELDRLADAFYQGVEADEEAADVWGRHFADE